jgi:hypothetical protein
MTDAGWTALAAIMASVCSLLAALFGHAAVKQGQETAAKLDTHEEADAARAAQIKAAVAPAIRRPGEEKREVGL